MLLLVLLVVRHMTHSMYTALMGGRPPPCPPTRPYPSYVTVVHAVADRCAPGDYNSKLSTHKST